MMEEQAQFRVCSDRTSWRVIEDQVIILDLDESEYFTLNPAASLLWNELADGATPDQLALSLRSKFAVNPDDARSDVLAFLQDGEKRGWIAVA